MAASAPTSRTTRRTRERLVAATRAEIAARGAFTAEAVATRSGHSPATFYSYFPSKSDALEAAFDAVLRDLVDFCADELAIERLLDEGLEARCRVLVAATSRFFAANERVFRCALAALPGSRSLRACYRRREAAAFEHHLRFVARGQKARLLRSGDPEALARGLLVLLQGLNNPAVVHGRRSDPLRRELGHALHRYLAPIAETGTRAPPA